MAAGGRELDRDSFPTVPSPNIEARVPRAAMDRQKIEISMEPGENGVLVAMFDEI
jgi:hypothetical protein